MISHEILEAEARVDRTAADLIEAQDKGFELLTSPPVRADDAQQIKLTIAQAQRQFQEALENLKSAYRKAD
jgi:hypothetical protein